MTETHTEAGREYVSAEPCHWGMFPVPAGSQLANTLALLPERRRRFDTLPMRAVNPDGVDVVI